MATRENRLHGAWPRTALTIRDPRHRTGVEYPGRYIYLAWVSQQQSVRCGNTAGAGPVQQVPLLGSSFSLSVCYRVRAFLSLGSACVNFHQTRGRKRDQQRLRLGRLGRSTKNVQFELQCARSREYSGCWSGKPVAIFFDFCFFFCCWLVRGIDHAGQKRAKWVLCSLWECGGTQHMCGVD